MCHLSTRPSTKEDQGNHFEEESLVVRLRHLVVRHFMNQLFDVTSLTLAECLELIDPNDNFQQLEC